jgi:hypothetical protein
VIVSYLVKQELLLKRLYSEQNWYDVWLPELAPSAELLKKTRTEQNDERGFCRFIKRYHTEMNKPGQFEHHELYTTRGSSQIIYDSDMAFTLRRDKRDGRILEAMKSRVVKEPDPFKFEIEELGGKVQLVYRGEYDEAESKKERARSLIPMILRENLSAIFYLLHKKNYNFNIHCRQ